MIQLTSFLAMVYGLVDLRMRKSNKIHFVNIMVVQEVEVQIKIVQLEALGLNLLIKGYHIS